MKRGFTAALLPLAMVAVLGPASRASAQYDELSFKLGAEGGYLSGSTTYRITIPTQQGLFESELVWPLDSWLAGLRATVEQEGRWSLDVVLRTNLTEDTGAMEDSDWQDGEKYVYSESDTTQDRFSALIFDGSGRYHFLQREDWSLGGVAGFLYQTFDLTASDLNQFSPVGFTEFNAVVDGPVVTYRVTSAIPYGGLCFLHQASEAFTIGADALLGYAFVDDEDNHLLRFKFSTAETEGPAVMLRLRGSYVFGDTYGLGGAWSIDGALEYLRADTTGSQDQIFYAGQDAGLGFTGIADDIDTSQVTVTAGVSYRFRSY